MNPYDLHRRHLAALITGDHEAAANLRQRLGRNGDDAAADLLCAATAISLEYRFGPGAGLGAGPIDFDELTEFLTELRRAGHGTEPPLDYLAIEAVVRALYGEPHLTEPLEPQKKSQALYAALQHQVERHPWLAENADWVVERAKQTALIWLVGRPVAD
ncbi:hypothetical protein [Glycomyces algeriensis]|uniref:Uncharacterized protein n=1 Tax=Glycomyces algeriensis TaxID=256037 RepID=A0A9W6GCH2_9ACTN|nr:hypothetical protein [Glycomyces algeriensis]MDA1368342.1 hypothetical protein [Glycomyces algeriensis]MDR7351783.1 hypothetical protein [Glycomyces algeriensis]GLI44511.1 hypothetical protein GALLR39Z86_43610 [Glycomyces algeriensis]